MSKKHIDSIDEQVIVDGRTPEGKRFKEVMERNDVMKIKDIIKEIKHDFTNSRKLWLESVEFKLYNPSGKLAKSITLDNFDEKFEYEELETKDYDYKLDESYINFAVVKCKVLLKEELL